MVEPLFQGVLLGTTVLVVTGTACSVADRLLRATGISGAAASNTVGNSAAVQQAVALDEPSYAAIAGAATVQAASVIVTAILTSCWVRRMQLFYDGQ